MQSLRFANSLRSMRLAVNANLTSLKPIRFMSTKQHDDSGMNLFAQAENASKKQQQEEPDQQEKEKHERWKKEAKQQENEKLAKSSKVSFYVLTFGSLATFVYLGNFPIFNFYIKLHCYYLLLYALLLIADYF